MNSTCRHDIALFGRELGYRLVLKTIKDIFYALSRVSFFLAVFLIILSSVEAVLKASAQVRYYFFILLVLVFSLHLLYASFIVFKLINRAIRHPRSLIGEIDNSSSGSRILILYDLYKKLPGSELTEAAFSEIYERHKSFSRINKGISLKKITAPLYAYLPLVLFAFLNLFHFSSDSAIYRIYYYSSDFTKPPSHILKNISAKLNVGQGDSLKILCLAEGEIPEYVDFKFRNMNRAGFSSVPVLRNNDSIFSHTITASSDFYYFFESAETATDTLFVNVFKRPEISGLRISVIPPEYTGLPVRVYSGVTNQVFAYKGSSFHYEITPTVFGTDSVIMYSDNYDSIIMGGTGDGVFKSEIDINEDRKFGFRLVKDHGPVTTRNSFSAEHRVTIIPDEYPVVNLIYPKQGHILDSSLQIPLFATAGDDFEVTEVYVFLRKIQMDQFAGSKKSEYIQIRIRDFEEKEGIIVVNQIIEAQVLNLYPDDRAELFVRVYDNDAVSGPKFSDSDIRTLHLPSIQELLSLSEEKYNKQENILKDELSKSISVMEDVKELTEKLKMNMDMSWEDMNRIDNMISLQQEMSESLERLEADIENNISLLDQNSLLSRETMEKYSKLQNMVDGLFTKEMKDKLQKLSDLRNSADHGKEQLSELLDDLESHQKEFQQGLEKSIAILEQIRTEFAIESLIRQIEFIILLQQDVNDRLITPESDLSGIYDDQKRGDSLYKDFYSDLEKNLAETGYSDFAEIIKSIQGKDLEKDYSDVLQSISDNSKSKAFSKGTAISGKLYDIKEQLADAKNKLLQEQKKEIMDDIYKVIDDMLLVSTEIEVIKNISKNLHASSPLSSETVIRFARARDLFGSISERLFDISKRTFFIDRRIIGSVGRSDEMFLRVSDFMINRRFSASYHLNTQLMGSLNSLMAMLLDTVEEIKNSDSPSGIDEMLRRMEEMASMQSQINKETSEMSINPDMFSHSKMQDMMNRLAMEQYQLYQQLMEIGGEQAMQPGGSDAGESGPPQPGEGAKMPGPGGFGASDMPGAGSQHGDAGKGAGGSLGNKLRDIADSMRDSGNMLEDRILNEHLLAKQNEIMQKFIDAIDSVRRERTDARREGKTANRKAVDPGRVDVLFETSLKELMIRSLRDGYTNDYRQKIRDYFRELEN